MLSIVNDRLVVDGRPGKFVPSPHRGGRIEPHIIVKHDTAGRLDGVSSVRWFCEPKSKVSAHFVVARDGAITQMVECDREAWHAGKSSYRGRANCNRFAIGIEFENPGRLVLRGERCWAWFGESWPAADCFEIDAKSHGGRGWWLPYTKAQLTAGEQLVRALAIAYPTITDVVGHFEISPGRKVDVGPHYPLDRSRAILGDRDAPLAGDVAAAQEMLAALGYWAGPADGLLGPRTRAAVRAFQEQNRVPITGVLDEATLDALADPAAKEMPSAGRQEATKDDLKASGSDTMAGAGLVKRGTETVGAIEIVKAAGAALAQPAAADAADPLATAGEVLARAEEGRSLAERAGGLVDWATTFDGLVTLGTLAVLAAVWFGAHRIEWARLRDHILGKNAGR